MWRLKGCPRCNGDLWLDCDDNRRGVWHCLACGWMEKPAQAAVGGFGWQRLREMALAEQGIRPGAIA